MIERQEGDRLVFEKSPSNRGCFIGLALFLLPFALLPLAGHALGLRGFESGVPWPLAIFSLLLFGSVSVLILYYSGPQEWSPVTGAPRSIERLSG
jgi:hypothetical protein